MMKPSLLSTALLSALCLGVTARASVDLGGGATLFPTATAGIQYNDNIFLSSSGAKSDTIMDLAPGIQLLFGQSAVNQGQLSYSEDFQFYNDDSGLNTGLAKVDFLSRYDDGKMKLDLNGWFHQVDQATRDVRGNGFLVRRNLTHGDATDEVTLTEKTSVSAGVGYDDTNYKNPSYVNWTWYDVPVKYYYKVEPKLDVSAGFRYRDNNLDSPGVDSKEYFYSVGARGELAPKATGEISVGLNQRELAGRSSTKNELGVESTLTYAYSPKTSAVFGINHDFGYSASGTPYDNFGLSGGVVAEVSSELKVGAQLYYSRYDYIGTQKDDFYQGQLSATYLVNAYVTVTGAYSYAKDNSNLAGASFKNNIFGVSAAFRY